MSEYRRSETVYNQEDPRHTLYLVVDGRVKVSRAAPDGQQVVMDIYKADDFFGEGAFLPGEPYAEMATALEPLKVMAWEISEIEDIVTRRPKLGIALLQLLVQRSMDFGSRIESFSTDTIPRRLARSLLRLSDKLGEQAEDGSIRMLPLTHEFLAQYVGTSREIITHHMNQFRRQGYLRYSRKGILLERSAWGEWLKQNSAAAA
ncbi:MAG: Crp/Fnr family transcriptional regulator [Acidobacteriota bacterium]